MRALISLVACWAVACALACSAARGETLTGVVLSQEGQPAAGATIFIATRFHSPPLRLTTRTDARGEFQIELPAVAHPQHHDLAIRWQGQGLDLVEATDAQGKPVEIAGQKLPPQIIRLRSAGQLKGKLLRAEDDGPIGGAKLFLDSGEVLQTDERGAFEMSGLPMKDHSLIPVAAGRVRPYVLFDTTLCPDARLEVRLEEGAVIRGRVLDRGNQPVAGAYLTRHSSGDPMTLNGWDEVCGPDGSFEYGGLSTKRLFYNLSVIAPGYEGQDVLSEVAEPTDVIERVIRLQKSPAQPAVQIAAVAVAEKAPNDPTAKLPRRTIAGTIHDEDGHTIEGAEVRWGTFLWDPSAKSAKTDAGGKYVLTDAPGEDGAILVIADGFAPQFAAAKAGSEHVDVRLSRGQTVRGVVRSAMGQPVADAQIVPSVRCWETGFCNPIWFDERVARTNGQGEFEIAAVPDCASFDILRAGYTDRRDLRLALDGEVNEIDLTAGGAIRGTVVDAVGRPVRNFNIRVLIPRVFDAKEEVGGYYAGFDWYGVNFTREDGVFVLTDLPAGAWMRLIVTSPGVGLAILDRVKSDPLDRLSPADKLTIRLEPFAPLRIQALDAASNQPVRGAKVSLLEDARESPHFNWGHDDLWATRMRTDRDGVAEFSEPACADGTILIRARGFARQRIMAAAMGRTMTLSLQPEARLTGHVLLAGRILTDGWVRLSSATGDLLGVELGDTGGTFNFDQLPAGQYQLSVGNNRGQSLHTQTIELEQGQTRTETITVPPPSESKPAS